MSNLQGASTEPPSPSNRAVRETGACRPGWLFLLDTVALVAVLGSLCLGAISSWQMRGPYNASAWGPTPLAWWLIATVVLLLVVPLALGPRPLATVLALATMIPATLAVAVVFQTVGFDLVIAVSAGALVIATLLGARKRSFGKGRVAVLALACATAVMAVLACGGDLVLRSFTTINVYGPSPDGRSTLAKYNFDAGAMSAAGDSLIVWRDDDGLLRHVRWVYYADQITGRARWLTSTTVVVDGHTVNILAVPPAGWN